MFYRIVWWRCFTAFLGFVVGACVVGMMRSPGEALWWPKDSVALYTLVLSIVTTGLWLQTGRLARGAEIQTESLKGAERPHVLVQNVFGGNMMDDGSAVAFICELCNFGRSPAWFKDAVIQPLIATSLPAYPPAYDEPAVMRESLAPNGGKRPVSQPLKVGPEEFRSFLRKEKEFFVFGYVAYADTFGDEHRTNFAYQLLLLQPPYGKDVFIPTGGAEYWRYT